MYYKRERKFQIISYFNILLPFSIKILKSDSLYLQREKNDFYNNSLSILKTDFPVGRVYCELRLHCQCTLRKQSDTRDGM